MPRQYRLAKPTTKMTAYDYENQKWVEGRAGTQIRLKQLTEEMELLSGPRGEEYFRFTAKTGGVNGKRDGMTFTNLAAAQKACRDMIAECEYELVPTLSQRTGRLSAAHTPAERGYINEILVDEAGNCTVFGELAHELWNYGRGDFMRHKSGNHGFFVLQKLHLNGRDCFGTKCSKSNRDWALPSVGSDCVLIECRASDPRPSILEMGVMMDAKTEATT
jgi:hypothetical protein